MQEKFSISTKPMESVNFVKKKKGASVFCQFCVHFLPNLVIKIKPCDF